MLDLDHARRVAADGKPDHVTTVSLRWIAQAISEIEAGRKAQEELSRRVLGKAKLDHDRFATARRVTLSGGGL